MPQGDKKSTFQIWKVKWSGVEFIAKINLTNDDADFLVCAWFLEWISSIAETVTIARLSNPGKHTDKTYRELTDELIKNMKLWKFTNNDPDWYATVYLEKNCPTILTERSLYTKEYTRQTIPRIMVKGFGQWPIDTEIYGRFKHRKSEINRE